MTASSLGSIIIVDDEAPVATALCEILTEQQYETIGFTRGEDALEAIKEREFDLLLTDLKMPKMDGIALLRAGLEIDPHLVGIIMTGYGTIETAVEALKIGAYDYVMKPFTPSTLLSVISRAMTVRKMRIENIQLRETMAIYELSKAIALTLDLKTILSKMADAALDQIEADEVSIMLPTPEGDELYVATVRGEERKALLGKRVPVGQGIAGWVARHHHECLTLNGEVNDPRFKPIRPRSDIYSAISMPMMVGGKLVGILNINATHQRRPFTAGQAKALSILTSTAASAFENARLYTQLFDAEKKYRSIFENAIEGIFQTTADGQFITANSALATIFGYDSPDHLIKAVTTLHQEIWGNSEDGAHWMRFLEAYGSIKEFESQLCRSDGSRIWISRNIHTVKDEDGNVLYYEGSVEDITKRKLAEEELNQSLEKLRNALGGIIQAMSLTVETRDPYTAGHQRRVATLASAIAQEMGLPLEKVDGIRMAGVIHDLGKLSVPAEILSKPTKLTNIEHLLIEVHPQAGYDILKEIEFPWPIAQIVLQHHERMDGGGYPLGLKGDEILLEARILVVADVVEAIASHRPYRPGLGIERALEEIFQNKGTLYDPEVVEACLSLFAEKRFELK